MRRAARLKALGGLHHDHLPLPYNGTTHSPDHADGGAPRPPRMAVEEWRFAPSPENHIDS